MNETRITVHGNVVSEPVERQARNGSIYTTFRVATTPYRRTPDGRFVDGDTSFYDVIAFNALAANVASALRKGQPVIVTRAPLDQAVPRATTAHRAPRRRSTPPTSATTCPGGGPRSSGSAGRRPSVRTARPTPTSRPRSARWPRASRPSDLRPAHVDADGVVDDDYDPESDGPTAAHDDDDVLATGDPETDDYEVVERLTA